MEYDERKADAIFVDETGGYGAGVVDDMRRRGYPVIGVQFGGKPNDYRYYDKRSEMLFELCDWIKKGGALAPDPGLKEELCALRYVYQGDKFRSEEHTSELQSLMRISYAVFCLKKQTK